MNDERFEELMRDAAHSYNLPPEPPPLDDMWRVIEAGGLRAKGQGQRSGNWGWERRWLQIAATLVIGIGIGRGSAILGSHRNEPVSTEPRGAVATAGSTARTDSTMSQPYQVATTRYLGETAALLIALPSEVKAGRADQQFIGRATDLLTTTRLLIDSPASNDPEMRNLLEDLELVLTQVVRMRNDRSRSELDLINRALEQREVIPRLRTAAADISAD